MIEHSKYDRQYTPKLWGREELIINTAGYCGKILWLKPGFRSSLHYHKRKHETFMCVAGLVNLLYMPEGPQGDYINTTILRGLDRDSIEIPPGIPHRFFAMGGGAAIIEFSTTHNDEDVIRLEDSCQVL
jgi:mannose-6-phosphate isomerase-like protein (cupin superfamily)